VTCRAARYNGGQPICPASLISPSETADNALATATSAAPGSGLSHFVALVLAKFSNAATTGTLTYKHGATTILTWPITGSDKIQPAVPIFVGDDAAVTATLTASGTPGITGTVTILGFTADVK